MTDISGSNTVSDGFNGHYTPTTEDIRAGWEYATAVIGDEGTAQFDRWLASTLQETQIAERERIIKLLEDPSNWYGINIAVYGTSAGTGYPNTKLVIALADFIRGENK
jgi:hypothetical protein